MRADELDALYAALAEALGRVEPRHAELLLATLVLDLIAHHDDAARVADAIARAERLSKL